MAFRELAEPLAELSNYPHMATNVLDYYGSFYNNTLMTNGNYNRESAMEVVEKDKADMGSFGRLFLAIPDLRERFKQGFQLNKPDPNTFYGGGPSHHAR